ncbi:hypothetical protein JRO89_XS12G0120800 [Xanthoceras sorbifolium]|uniref:cytokinin riboside 5'-monophosphate phosphoribohydrolase n=1 Tax=Xanthoceras sorbifolium TaxID=99658 RepID=A0ABQ8HCD3_9ROSI|nr:hypothetical protein JRO89_XS12G0120800 [Xanthoceras sorbifolium]
MEETKSRFKRICVFCGSSSGKKASYQEAAIELGKELVTNEAFFFFLFSYTFFIITGESVGEVRAVSGMHQRKAEMSRQADAFIALPGMLLIFRSIRNQLLRFVVTFELFYHDLCLTSEVGLLNVDGYYNSLLSFIDEAVDEGFISPIARRIIISSPTPKQLVRQLEVNTFHLFFNHTSYNNNEYVPEYDEKTSKLVWEERLNYVAEPGVAT